MINRPGAMNYHGNPPGTMKNQPGVVQGGFGWLQVATGDSKEKVIIFRDRQTDKQTEPSYYI